VTIRVVDVETTGLAPPHGVVELACVDLEEESGQICNGRVNLVNPGRPIPADARAIHHICDNDVKNDRSLKDVAGPLLHALPDPIAFAAHNAQFEMQWLEEFTGKVPWICTKKISYILWPESPDHKNQTLRYFLDVKIPEALHFCSQVTHRAFPDAVVTACILREALKRASLPQLAEWSQHPAYLLKMPIRFGRHRGTQWADLPKDYLQWLADKSERDASWNAKIALGIIRDPHIADNNDGTDADVTIGVPGNDGAGISIPVRDSPEAIIAGYLKLSLFAIERVLDVEDLDGWWRMEARRRAEYGIKKGDKNHKLIADAFTKQKKKLLAVVKK
jgi:exodeoxyribonuclease X